jgi:hypothetical protein
MSEISISRIAYILALIGGILMVILGLLGFIGSSFGPRELFQWGYDYGGIVTIICGVVAIIGAKNASTLVWAIVLIIVGVVGGGFGGLLVALGGILGLLTVLLKKQNV